jgi:hypothetical protein
MNPARFLIIDIRHGHSPVGGAIAIERRLGGRSAQLKTPKPMQLGDALPKNFCASGWFVLIGKWIVPMPGRSTAFWRGPSLNASPLPEWPAIVTASFAAGSAARSSVAVVNSSAKERPRITRNSLHGWDLVKRAIAERP